MQYPPSSLTIGAVQPRLRLPGTAPIEAAEHAAHQIRRASAQHDGKIDLIVLPELSPIGYSEDTFENCLPRTKEGVSGMESFYETIGAIDLMFANLAKELNCFICYGTIGVLHGKHKQFTIRQIVVNDSGEVICFYDKLHLCNYGDCAETRYFVPGSKPCSFHCRGFQIGIIICADMRNPTLCRQLAGAHKCDVILQPAAFSRDISFRTWQSFRETRAVENSVYFVGINYAGDYYGNTSFVEPWVDEHHEPVVLDTTAGVLVKQVERDVLTRVRKDFPYYNQLMSEDWSRDDD